MKHGAVILKVALLTNTAIVLEELLPQALAVRARRQKYANSDFIYYTKRPKNTDASVLNQGSCNVNFSIAIGVVV